MKLIIKKKGGAGSGFHGHSGRPGKIGGSSASGGGSFEADEPSEVVSYNSTHRSMYKDSYDVKGGAYRPKRDIEVWIDTGETKKTNQYYGSAQILKRIYTKSHVGQTDKIEILPGGFFVTRAGAKDRQKLRFTEEPESAFDKDWLKDKVPVGYMEYIG